MCDYSLAHFPNRLAVEGEQLVVHRFAMGSLGLAPARSIMKQVFSCTSLPAVCVPPGARLLLQDIPERLQQGLNVGAVEEVTFVQQSAEAFQYRDAVRFANGRETLLQQLACGQRVRVVSLDSAHKEQAEPVDWRQIHDVSPSENRQGSGGKPAQVAWGLRFWASALYSNIPLGGDNAMCDYSLAHFGE